MAHEYNISEDGLELIKAYEGFRPVETVLVSGQKVIGYGHPYVLGEASLLTQQKAEDILRADLEPIEKAINHIVHAPMSQSQFDALASLVFNIGIDAFSESTVLHYLNNGQPLAAAAGFDEWRKSIVAEKTYIIDALVRRRTAEKALFLNPASGIVAAPRYEVPAMHDDTVMSGEDDIEIFVNADGDGFVEQTPYVETPVQEEAPEDASAGALVLSERAAAPQIYEEEPDANLVNDIVTEDNSVEDAIIDNVVEIRPESEIADQVEMEVEQDVVSEQSVEIEPEEDLSPIAIAAADVSERLDNLMEETEDESDVDTVEASSLVFENEDAAPEESVAENEPEVLEAELTSEPEPEIEIEEALSVEPEAVETDIVETEPPEIEPFEAASENDTALEQTAPKTKPRKKNKGAGVFWTALIVGLSLIGASLWQMKFSPVVNLGALGEFLAPVVLLVGAMMIMGGMLYMVKAQLRGKAA